MDAVLPLAALIISASGFLFGVFTFRRAAGVQQVAKLENRVGELEAELEKCERDRLRLMERLFTEGRDGDR